MVNDLVSIIVPAYNVEKNIPYCLDSLINQTYKNIEIICVNDGSKDSSLDIIKEYAAKDDRIRIVDKKNGGLSSARNAGIDIAEGEYYAFVDSDDFVDVRYTQRLMELIKEHSADISRCRGRGVTSYDYVEPTPENPPVISERNAHEALEIFYDDKFYGWYADDAPVVWNCLYKAEIFNDLRFEEKLRKCEDECFTREAFSRCDKIVYTDERLYFYYNREDSLIHSKTNDPEFDFNMFLNIHKRRQSCFKQFGFEDIRMKDVDAACRHFIQVYQYADNKSLKKKIRKEFKSYYIQLESKPMQIKVFNFSPFIYKLALKILYK